MTAHESGPERAADAPAYRRIFDLTGRDAVVVGAASGIGAVAAAALAAFGASVVCADVDERGLAATVARITGQGGTARSAVADVRSPEDMRRLAGECERTRILLVTPATNVRKRLGDVTDDEFDRIVDLNLRGMFLAVREFGTRMAARSGGSIITVSSIRSQVVEPGQGVYAATKAAVVQLTRAAAAEWGTHGVRANVLVPGIVDTPLAAQIRADPRWRRAYADKSALRRWGRPEELAGAVVYLASEASGFVTGSSVVVDGGWLASTAATNRRCSRCPMPSPRPRCGPTGGWPGISPGFRARTSGRRPRCGRRGRPAGRSTARSSVSSAARTSSCPPGAVPSASGSPAPGAAPREGSSCTATPAAS
ncbi:SDR family oxidoreductase [Actinomadura sp. B10D3]|uniref:SDR family NAD(P)-dependent oxidoreductase n=1 Tax=Actinomadura sp. B10D3 TaxID=3153557 RepID=UPI00325D63FB